MYQTYNGKPFGNSIEKNKQTTWLTVLTEDNQEFKSLIKTKNIRNTNGQICYFALINM
jgi:hypothetical protein